MTIETNATLSALSKLIGFVAGQAGGLSMGIALVSFLTAVAPPWLAWLRPLFFLVAWFGGHCAIALFVDFVSSHITADCPDNSCGGRVHPLGTMEYRCDRCGKTHSSQSTGGSGFGPVVRRVEARLERALHFGRRGRVSLHQSGGEGALSNLPREGALSETEKK